MEKKSFNLVPKLDISSAAIILWNLTPLAGVIFWGWKPESAFICYALETIVLGIFNVFKLITVYYYGMPPAADETGVKGLGVIPFFIFHYYFFVFVQLSIFFAAADFGPTSLFKILVSFVNDAAALPALGVFVVSTAYQFVNDFVLPRTFEKRTMLRQMFEPYPRIFVQQFVVILGSFFFAVTGNGWPVLIIFVGIKTYFELLLKGADLITFAKEYQKKAEAQGESFD